MTTAPSTLPRAKNAWRYRIFWHIFRFLARPYLRLTMRFTAERAPRYDAPVLVLANHNTDLDPALVALSFGKQMYFVASEHIFRWGRITRLLNYLFAPIPLIKGRSDARAAMGIMQALRSGKNICVFAEGNRSVDGLTAPISPATGVLAKAGADLVTYRLEGGYFTQPRWAKSMRRGRMRGYVVGHYPAALLKDMRAEEINAIIRRDLHEDAYARQAENPVAFRGKHIAESLETVLYLCPSCGQLGTLASRDDRFTCTCGLSARYTETGYLTGEGVPFDTVAKWVAWQLTQVAPRIEAAGAEPFFHDEAQSLYTVIPCERADLVAQGTLSMTREALLLGPHRFALADIADMAIVGQMTLTFSLRDGGHYEIKSALPRSGYKYLHAFDALRKQAGAQNTQAKG